MDSKIRVLIADDNKEICMFISNFLKKKEDVEILGIANTDEDEIKMIDNLKPEIVITDLMRNHKNTGLDIIKNYFGKDNSPKFLVISAGDKNEIYCENIDVAGFIKKPFFDYEIIYSELKRIKENI
ncbi:MAG: response regulator [Clostridiales bacterium]|nr:response regulator [Clostridiales bacterium]